MTDSGLMAHFLGISEPKVLLEDYIVGIEVKASESVNIQDFQDLRWFQSVVGKEHFTGVLLSRLCQPKNGNGLRHRVAGHFKFHFT